MNVIIWKTGKVLKQEGEEAQELLVAVYGTLKRGMGNHHLLKNSKYLGKAVSVARFLLGHGGFPAVIPSMNGKRIVVELYEISSISKLDQLEGYPVHYDRKKFSFVTPDGRKHRAWLYFYHSPGSYHNWDTETDNDLPFSWSPAGWKPVKINQNIFKHRRKK